ncbi:MAG TPA: PKD domain-containing protein [bacterium]|nr:PKD domain-containing protein [bacterium]
MNAPLRLALLCCTCALLLPACGDGGTAAPPVDPDPGPTPVTPVGPRIVGIAVPAAESGESATFRAAIEGVAHRYAWDFGGGAEPNTSDHPEPMVRFGTPGTYQGSLTVARGDITSAPFIFEYEVIAPRVAKVIAVEPAGVVGIEGGTATFRVISNGTPTAFEWHFGAGAAPSFGDVAEPTVTLRAPGTYGGTVTVTNEFGISPSFGFTYTVASQQVPVVTIVTPTGSLANYGGTRTFVARATNNPSQYTWDFGGGATPETATGQTPEVELTALGTYTGTVTAHNASGASVPFAFQYTVEVHPQAPVIQGINPAAPFEREGGDYLTLSTMHSNPGGGPLQFRWTLQGTSPPSSSNAAPWSGSGSSAHGKAKCPFRTGLVCPLPTGLAIPWCRRPKRPL